MPSNDEPTTQDLGWVKMMRTPDILELIETYPLAFALAAVIALRSRFQPGVSIKGLHPGECFLGDFDKYGISEQQYRTAKKQLEKGRFATFKTTNKGTVAQLIDTRLFDVLNAAASRLANSQLTDKQRLTKNGKNEKTTEPEIKPLRTADRIGLENKLRILKSKLRDLEEDTADQWQREAYPEKVAERDNLRGQVEAVETELLA